MRNIVKSKFTGMLRGLLRRFDDTETKTVQPPRPVASPAPAVAPAAVAPARPQFVSTPAPAPKPAPAAKAEELQLPLGSVVAALPMDLRAKLAQAPPPGTFFSVPVEKILAQLAHGSVKISFGELRTGVPGLFVNSGGENDERQVVLPLNEILGRLHPGLLSRRSAQKQVELSEDITGPFGAGGEGARISTATRPTPLA